MNAQQRLTGDDLKKFRPNRRMSGNFFSIAASPREGKLAWTCVVSKKVSQKAVVRNKIKRQCRMIVRATLKTAKEKMALVVHAKKGSDAAPFSELRSDLESLLKRTALRGTMPHT